MPNMLFANNCNTTLNGGITAIATSMVVTSATGFPVPTGSQYFYCTLADAATQTTIEIVKVTAVSGTTFTIVRGQDGTTGTIFASGAVVSLRLVRASLNDFPKLDETNTFTADQAITGQLTSSAGLATTGTFTATAPSDGLVMDYATGFGRFSAFAGDGFQWYNAGIANTKLMQLSSTGVITTATWNGATIGVGYGGTGLTSFTANGIIYASSSSVLAQSANLTFNGTILSLNSTASTQSFSGSNLNIGIGTAFSAGQTDIYTTSTNPIGFGTTGSAAVRFFTNSTEAARIDPSQNFLVGVSSVASGVNQLVASNQILRTINVGTINGSSSATVQIKTNPGNTSNSGSIYMKAQAIVHWASGSMNQYGIGSTSYNESLGNGDYRTYSGASLSISNSSNNVNLTITNSGGSAINLVVVTIQEHYS